MPLNDTELAINDAEEVLVSLEADLTEDAIFGVRTLEVTASSVTVRGPGGVVLAQVPVAEARSARNEPLVSGGRLVLQTKSGEELPLVTYSMTRAHQFSEAARGIEQLCEGKPFDINLQEEKTRCDKCGRLLPEKDGVCPNCVKRGKTMLRILRFVKPYKGRAVLVTLTALCSTMIQLVPPKIQGAVIDNFSKGDKSLQFLFTSVALWAGVVLTASLLQIANGRMTTWLGCYISSDLRTTVYRSIEFLKLSYFDKKQVGAVASRVAQDTERVWFFLVDGLPWMILNFLLMVSVSVLIFLINWKLALAILSPIPVVAVLSCSLWKPISNLFHKVSQKTARVHMHLNESLTGIRVVKAFAKEDHEYARFVNRSNELRDAAANADMTWNTMFGAMTFCVSIGTVIHWAYGGWMLFTGELSLGQFWVVLSYLAMAYGPLQWFAMLNNWFSRAMAGGERIFEIIDMVPEPSLVDGVKSRVVGEVEFDGVRFGYDKSNPVINGVSFTAAPGEMIGLVGHSGAGKSTTINLISRFYEPDAGVIRIDGIDYRELDLRDYRSQIGIVLQEPFLFHGTILENITYGNPEASFDQAIEAAKAAYAHDFILSKPDGYDTLVGERGSKLSGGEKQRISIARAILHDPKILILDEATSSVDVETEKQIQAAIAHLIKGRTTFAIAHRLSTLRNADRLVVLEKGKIAEIGTHEELMEKKGVFYRLVKTQTEINEIIGVGAVG